MKPRETPLIERKTVIVHPQKTKLRFQPMNLSDLSYAREQRRRRMSNFVKTCNENFELFINRIYSFMSFVTY